jgi:hypothetical protein
LLHRGTSHAATQTELTDILIKCLIVQPGPGQDVRIYLSAGRLKVLI